MLTIQEAGSWISDLSSWRWLGLIGRNENNSTSISQYVHVECETVMGVIFSIEILIINLWNYINQDTLNKISFWNMHHFFFFDFFFQELSLLHCRCNLHVIKIKRFSALCAIDMVKGKKINMITMFNGYLESKFWTHTKSFRFSFNRNFAVLKK